jgi:uncharacterized membrane protein (DUF106 family)
MSTTKGHNMITQIAANIAVWGWLIWAVYTGATADWS